MAIYGNLYYPDSRNSTWSDIAALTWAQTDFNWISGNSLQANSTASWSYVTYRTDLGAVKTFYPTTRVVWDKSQPVTIQYEYSLDDATYTLVTPQPITARYIRTNITTTGSYLSSIDTLINTNTISETASDISTATLAGNVNMRTLPFTNFSTITAITFNANTTETKTIAGQVVSNDNAGNVKVKIVDLDTWGKTAINANVNITATGFPKLTANATLGTVTITTG
jgi:hypothetical protein